MNIEEHVERVESENVQIENSRVEENGKPKIKNKKIAKNTCSKKNLERP